MSAVRDEPMSDGTTSGTSGILLAHHLKQLKLPTVLREYDKAARECAQGRIDHPRYLLRPIRPTSDPWLAYIALQLEYYFCYTLVMTKEPVLPLADLIASKAARGMTRAQIACAVGCSRVQLWRLESGDVREDTRVGRRLRAYLEDPNPVGRELSAAIEACVGADGNRSRKLIHLLRLINDLGRPG